MPDDHSPRDATADRLRTIVAHDEPHPMGAVVPPIYQSSLFTFPSYDELGARFRGESTHAVYSRVDNPTTGEFERKTPLDETVHAIYLVVHPYANPLLLQHNLDLIEEAPAQLSNLVLRSLAP